jgi:uncharacterized membrane protein
VSTPAHGWSDQRVEQTVGNLLRVGLLIATALVIVGAFGTIVMLKSCVPSASTTSLAVTVPA